MKHIIVVGRGHGGTRLMAGTLAKSGAFTGKVNGQHYDHTPPSKMYRAVQMFGAYVIAIDNYRWDFTQAIQMEPPDNYQRLVIEYLEELFDVPKKIISWKLPEAILALPWLIKMFPDAYYIHWIRDGRDSCLAWNQTDNFEYFNIPAEQRYENYYNGAVSWHYIESLVEETPKPAHWITIRFEDFVMKQDETLEELEEFLQLSLVKIPVVTDRANRWEREKHDLNGVIEIMNYHLKRYGYDELNYD